MTQEKKKRKRTKKALPLWRPPSEDGRRRRFKSVQTIPLTSRVGPPEDYLDPMDYLKTCVSYAEAQITQWRTEIAALPTDRKERIELAKERAKEARARQAAKKALEDTADTLKGIASGDASALAVLDQLDKETLSRFLAAAQAAAQK